MSSNGAVWNMVAGSIINSSTTNYRSGGGDSEIYYAVPKKFYNKVEKTLKIALYMVVLSILSLIIILSINVLYGNFKYDLILIFGSLMLLGNGIFKMFQDGLEYEDCEDTITIILKDGENIDDIIKKLNIQKDYILIKK